MRIFLTETGSAFALPTEETLNLLPRGLGRDGYKPLMRNRAPIYAASPKEYCRQQFNGDTKSGSIAYLTCFGIVMAIIVGMIGKYL